ncbi:unnamed protein product [Candida verbasci]|uniref:nitric oxide dioxygenase n=1 Tax=Candida verbasci TaxID=1227364 RepID=A0A9W4TS92_9ASCO|nr:unnamed protein product [Candida verbasci]
MVDYQIKELTKDQIKIILDTVPILEQAGESLTAKFYQRMIGGYDEVKPFFNTTDQKSLRQPKILAFALLNYAKNIQDLSPLTGFVQQIVSKHVGLQVKAEHYPIVGTCLIETMIELLPKEVATSEFIEAWATAYGNLAKILIDAEQQEYNKQPWKEFKNFKVSKIEKECDDVKSIYLTPEDSTFQIPINKPGQYLCIRWQLPNEKFEISREYSISDIPKDNEYRISVRHLKDGKISSYIHNELKVGDVLKIAPPNGNFVYDDKQVEKPLVAVVGGIGITPIVSIVKSAIKQNRKIVLINCNKDVKSRPFENWLKSIKSDNVKIIEYFDQEDASVTDIIDKAEKRRLEMKDLDFITENDDVYLLGPRGFMKVIKTYLNDKKIDVKLEYFGPMDV